jgi:hypothetical protein
MNEQRPAPTRLSFGIANLLMLIAIIAISFAWLVDRNRLQIPKHDIPGPIFITYTVQTSPASTSSQSISAIGIDFMDGNVIVYTSNGGEVIPANKIVQFSWDPE